MDEPNSNAFIASLAFWELECVVVVPRLAPAGARQQNGVFAEAQFEVIPVNNVHPIGEQAAEAVRCAIHGVVRDGIVVSREKHNRSVGPGPLIELIG
jgi:hypothetical protein